MSLDTKTDAQYVTLAPPIENSEKLEEGYEHFRICEDTQKDIQAFVENLDNNIDQIDLSKMSPDYINKFIYDWVKQDQAKHNEIEKMGNNSGVSIGGKRVDVRVKIPEEYKNLQQELTPDK